ncbi:MAG: hypothetical protein LBT00_12975 [Spirochaetaceae bacterium]|jgi:hypothetical protein|nr:hypothetical protein [Spirochaetaceae bacterium]
MALGHDTNEPRKIIHPRGEVVGIGTFKMKKSAMLKLEIPRLSFVLIKEAESSFVAVCVHLRTDGYGATMEYAILDMIENAYYQLKENFLNPFREKAWESLEDWFQCDEWASKLWDAYHSVQIEMAKQGCPTDNFDILEQKIERLERRLGKLESEEVESLKKKISKYKNTMSLQYGMVGEEAA